MKCILNMKLQLNKIVEVLSKIKDDEFYFKNYEIRFNYKQS